MSSIHTSNENMHFCILINIHGRMTSIHGPHLSLYTVCDIMNVIMPAANVIITSQLNSSPVIIYHNSGLLYNVINTNPYQFT